MQLRTFNSFIRSVITEGNRLQRVDINGQILTSSRFTQTQLISGFLALIYVFVSKAGFSESFAGYVISFLSIFIGLFSSIVISLFDKSFDLKERYLNQNAKAANNAEDPSEIVQIKKARNYLKQFTGLTSYAIYKAICIISLLLLTLLTEFFNNDISSYKIIRSISDITFKSGIIFLNCAAVYLYRFLVIYLLINFFVITLYAVTSYFSYILEVYKKQIEKND